jgi:hypothetical protein
MDIDEQIAEFEKKDEMRRASIRADHQARVRHSMTVAPECSTKYCNLHDYALNVEGVCLYSDKKSAVLAERRTSETRNRGLDEVMTDYMVNRPDFYHVAEETVRDIMSKQSRRHARPSSPAPKPEASPVPAPVRSKTWM